MPDDQTPPATPPVTPPEAPGQTFTQADVDRLISERLKRERDATKAKYADYDDLKKAADGRKTAEDRIAELERQTVEANARALRADVANQHKISPEDRDLFLTGTDPDTLQAQAKRLEERDSDRKRRGNHVPTEGNGNQNPPADPLRDFTAGLFGRNT